MPTTVLTIASRKGGAGKTSIASLLAAAYAARGVSVTLIDADPQGSLTRQLVDETPGPEHTGLDEIIRGVLDMDGPLGPRVTTAVPTIGQPVTLNAWADSLLIPPGPKLSTLANTQIDGALTMMRRITHQITSTVTIIDTPGDLGLLTTAALAAADLVVIPVVPDYLGCATVPDTLARAAAVDAATATETSVIIVPNNTNSTTIHRTYITALHAEWPEVVTQPIPTSKWVTTASAKGLPVTAIGSSRAAEWRDRTKPAIDAIIRAADATRTEARHGA